jgi:hypothetical protein
MLGCTHNSFFSITIFHYAEFEGGGGEGPQVSPRTIRRENMHLKEVQHRPWELQHIWSGLMKMRFQFWSLFILIRIYK